MLQLQDFLCLQAIILVRVFNQQNVFYKGNAMGSKQSRRHLSSLDSFLVQLLHKPTRVEVSLNLVLTNAEELIKEVKIGNNLSCSNVLVEFLI